MTADAGNSSDGPNGGASAAGSNYLLTLFVTGQSIRSQRAVANLRRLCEALHGQCELTIVDVLERPQLAEDEKIMATPTVIRHRPLPVRRVIGDLSDPDKVILWLDLPPANAATVGEGGV
jgi:circadian clock protein KaiB